MKNKKIIILIIILFILIFVLFLYKLDKNNNAINNKKINNNINNNEENKNNISNIIYLYSPQPNDLVDNDFFIKGEARGNWFFEATAPFFILDANFATITSGIINAQSDWMTEDFVTFNQEVHFTPTTNSGYLILKNDNPSGLPEKDLYLRIPLKFNKN